MTKHSLSPTQRFSDRVDDYAKYRPSYPSSAVDFIVNLLSDSARLIADIGSGTGILTRLLLERGLTVAGVEPNAAMRTRAEVELAAFPGFRSITGTAEATGLADQSCGLVVAAQAFHWFDPVPTRAEFSRVLAPGGHIALIWNHRHPDSSPSTTAYDQIISDFNTDYTKVKENSPSEADIARFLGSKGSKMRTDFFPYAQQLDLEGLIGRITSSSYMPNRDHARYPELDREIRHLFEKHAVGGMFELCYRTTVFSAPG